MYEEELWPVSIFPELIEKSYGKPCQANKSRNFVVENCYHCFVDSDSDDAYFSSQSDPAPHTPQQDRAEVYMSSQPESSLCLQRKCRLFIRLTIMGH